MKLLHQPAAQFVVALVMLGAIYFFTPVHSYLERHSEKVYSTGEIKIGQVVWVPSFPWFGPVYVAEIPLDFGDKHYMSSNIEAIFDVQQGEEWADVFLNGNGDVVGKSVLHLLKSKKPSNP